MIPHGITRSANPTKENTLTHHRLSADALALEEPLIIAPDVWDEVLAYLDDQGVVPIAERFVLREGDSPARRAVHHARTGELLATLKSGEDYTQRNWIKVQSADDLAGTLIDGDWRSIL